MPRYWMVATDIKEGIESGRWSTKLPPIRELAVLYGENGQRAGQWLLDKAIELLVAAGYVERRNRLGTFILPAEHRTELKEPDPENAEGAINLAERVDYLEAVVRELAKDRGMPFDPPPGRADS